MQSVLSKLRVLPLVLAALATGSVTLATAGPTLAKDKRKVERAEPPLPSLNGRAAVAVVSIKDQRISLYNADGVAVRSRISSGQTGYETPVGVFSVLQKEVEHFSNLYDDAAMPHMQRITWSGIALHAGVLPGHPASHGCVRLNPDFARRIFPLTKVGMRVVISRDDVAPVSIAHPALFKPEPIGETAVATPVSYDPADIDDERVTIMDPDVRDWPARQAMLDALKAEAKAMAEEAKAAVTEWETSKGGLKKHAAEVALVAKRDRAAEAKKKAEARLAKAEKVLAGANTPKALKRAEKAKAEAATALATVDAKLAGMTAAALEADNTVAKIKSGIAAAETAKTAAVTAAADAQRKTLPVSVFVSLKSQKLYVRQGNEPVFDTQVAVADPDRPIGTHVFTALDFANEGDGVRWNVVTISHRPSAEDYGYGYDDERPRQRKNVETAGYAPPATDPAGAAAALDRIQIPADVRARLSQYVWPGSSLIVSDEELSKETGKATDFIVVSSTDPQGALKKRKRQPPPSTYRDFYDDGYYYSYQPYRPYSRYDRRRPPQGKSVFSWW